MKKIIMISAVAAFVMGTVTTASAGSFNTKRCKACHSVSKDKVGPAWADVAKAYENSDSLAKVFKDGFKVEDRKMVASNKKWKHKAGIMTGQFKHLIKGHEDEVAKALFASVKAGKI